MNIHSIFFLLFALLFPCNNMLAEDIFLPKQSELNRDFDERDEKMFLHPDKLYYPEIWVDCLGGNLSKKGILADLEAIAGGGFSGVQFFFGNRGGLWPGVDNPILCLTPEWDDFVRYAAQEAQRLGLRFTLQNCPGWAMAGGPWIEPDNSMRHLVWTETQINGGRKTEILLPCHPHRETEWRDYKDLMILAFPTPLGSTRHLLPQHTESDMPQLPWHECLMSGWHPFHIPATQADKPHWVEITMPKAETVRTIEFSSVQGFSHWFCYEPGVNVKMEAIYEGGDTLTILHTDMPASNWQDNMPISLSCTETAPTRTYRLSITNRNNMAISSLRLLSAARKNNWESEAAWTLRNIMYNNEEPGHPKEAYVDRNRVTDLSKLTDEEGWLRWDAPEGEWTVLRIGHVNSGMKNAPAPPEATGWECNKFDTEGAEKHFDGYIGRLKRGPLAGLLDGMLLDSWECETQTWTKDMETEFRKMTGYDLRPWLPALMGYVIDTPETTSRFLRDWRGTINELVVNRFYKRMAELGRENGLSVTYETAAGDVFPADIMEYFKHADIPMCEFWQHNPEVFVGSLNFKPIKPTVSAARLYGKPRIGVEAFTSMQLTWDEKLRAIKETANKNRIEGATHFAFQAYTHNPLPDVLVPGSSFGSDIGTPFLRSQTWWRHMHEFTTYTARSTYMLERGHPVSDFLWYLGDEIDHKPDQLAAFPDGFKYDYCNPDALLNRLSVTEDGKLSTPEGIRYNAMWMPNTHRMLPETLEKLVQLVQDGAVIIGNRPRYPATLSLPEKTQERFNKAVSMLWGDTDDATIRKVGRGKVMCNMSVEEAIEALGMVADVQTDGILWLHRQTENADWYYVCPPPGHNFEGAVDFNQHGAVELWNPVNGNIENARVEEKGDRTLVHLKLEQGETRFVVFRKDKKQGMARVASVIEEIPLEKAEWTLQFPDGWGVVPQTLSTNVLKAWKDLALSDEGKAFSGTVTYNTSISIKHKKRGFRYILDLGRVESIAKIRINGQEAGTLWTYPYRTDISKHIKKGKNKLEVEITNTWFNRLVFDANQPETQRKTWTINAPHMSSPLRESGMLGPVRIQIEQ